MSNDYFEKPKNTEQSTEQQPINVNVNVAAPQPPRQQTIVINHDNQPGCLVSALWFLFIGWWLALAWTTIAWGWMITVIGIPIAVWMINRIPKLIGLREPSKETIIHIAGDTTVVEIGKKPDQLPLLLRIPYFFIIGWWLTGFWMGLAYLVCCTILLMPIGFWMFDKTPAVLTLQKS